MKNRRFICPERKEGSGISCAVFLAYTLQTWLTWYTLMIVMVDRWVLWKQ